MVNVLFDKKKKCTRNVHIKYIIRNSNNHQVTVCKHIFQAFIFFPSDFISRTCRTTFVGTDEEVTTRRAGDGVRRSS